jgi:2-polyprenyl-6-methoxyphenol hydroxylase-like FAD-dependent oxidoreductase
VGLPWTSSREVHVTALGSAIALHGNGLRVLDALGLLDSCVAQGYPFSP